MNEDGYAHFSALENLALRARVSLKETEEAINCFTAPDINSANQTNDGRRVERVPGGFMVLNAEQHRKTISREIQREQTRIRVIKHRKERNVTKSVTAPLQNVTPVYVYASVCSNSKRLGTVKSISNTRARGSLEELEKFCLEIGLPATDGEWFFNKCEGNGWLNSGKAIKDWRATIRAWKTAGYLPSSKKKAEEPEWRE